MPCKVGLCLCISTVMPLDLEQIYVNCTQPFQHVYNKVASHILVPQTIMWHVYMAPCKAVVSH